jgi:hypothetical protein
MGAKITAIQAVYCSKKMDVESKYFNKIKEIKTKFTDQSQGS